MKFLLDPVSKKVEEAVPRVCERLQSQTSCSELLQYCDPNSSLDVCTGKMVLLHATHGFSPTFPIDYARSTFHGVHSVCNAAYNGWYDISESVYSTLNKAAVGTETTDSYVTHAAGRSLEFAGFMVDLIFGLSN